MQSTVYLKSRSLYKKFFMTNNITILFCKFYLKENQIWNYSLLRVKVISNYKNRYEFIVIVVNIVLIYMHK